MYAGFANAEGVYSEGREKTDPNAPASTVVATAEGDIGTMASPEVMETRPLSIDNGGVTPPVQTVNVNLETLRPPVTGALVVDSSVLPASSGGGGGFGGGGGGGAMSSGEEIEETVKKKPNYLLYLVILGVAYGGYKLIKK